MKIEYGHTYYFRDRNRGCIASFTVCDIMGSYFSFIYNGKMLNCEYQYAKDRIFESPEDLLKHEHSIQRTVSHSSPMNDYPSIWEGNECKDSDYLYDGHDDRTLKNNNARIDTAFESWAYYFDDDSD